MRARLRHHAPALALLLLAGVAVLVAVLAESLAWPVAPAFPALHSGSYAYVAGSDAFRTALAARAVAWCAAALVIPLLIAAVVAVLVRGRRSRGRAARP
ncbi:hypothetical protein ABC270_15005 [Curtobacterium sp. 1P10AnD]|uniref:hypothetical protein n=1 Tax=Curtobacterium sp. 1P10AnD TaxID=3132283 RepID=UPI0039A0A87C